MKIGFRDIESFVTSPAPYARVILVYGPDQGLVRERCNSIGKTVVQDLNDPFNVAALSSDIIADDPARLIDEASAMSMMGGDRLIRVSDASDKITMTVKSYLEAPHDSALIVLHGGELSPRSSLRKLCESAKNAAAIPCYVDDERGVAQTIRHTMQAEGHAIQPDAVAWLSANISGDRGKVRSELEKLAIYKGDEKTPITVQDAQAACGAAGVQGFDDLVYAVAGRRTDAAMKAYSTLMAEGVAFVAILRALQNHFRRLHMTRAQMNNGMDLEGAMKTLSPPVFFKQAPQFKSQLNSWNSGVLDHVLARLTALEAQCKQTGMPVETLCAQAILAISKIRA